MRVLLLVENLRLRLDLLLDVLRPVPGHGAASLHEGGDAGAIQVGLVANAHDLFGLDLVGNVALQHKFKFLLEDKRSIERTRE